MSNFFYADKPNRNAAFSFKNGIGSITDDEPHQALVNGDQSAQVHPVPAGLGTSQKVGNPQYEPSPAAPGPVQNAGREPAGSAYNNG